MKRIQVLDAEIARIFDSEIVTQIRGTRRDLESLVALVCQNDAIEEVVIMDLESLDQIKALDKADMLGSIKLMPQQCTQAWEEAGHITFPADYNDIHSVVVAGMGGSALGPDIIKAVFSEQMRVPFEVSRDYQVPGYVNQQTLVILSSYSGTTEETLAAAEDAKGKGAKLVGISKGGILAEWAKTNRVPFYEFDTKNNPSNSPRMAVAYSLFGMLRFLDTLGILKQDETAIKAAITYAQTVYEQLKVELPVAQNQAKQAAEALHDRKLMIFAADHLAGNAHVFANQTNETAKTPSASYIFSELNHHLLEGFNFPPNVAKQVHVVLLNSPLYRQRQKDRIEVTLDVLKQRSIQALVFDAKGATKLDQVVESLVFSGLTTYYLAMLNGIDPTPNPDVDYLKAQLATKGDWHGRI